MSFYGELFASRGMLVVAKTPRLLRWLTRRQIVRNMIVNCLDFEFALDCNNELGQVDF
jgi:hypothetical protein